MPSNTPLPAAEFRRIDDKLYYYAMAVLNKGDRGAWGDEECALFGFCCEYRAARAASTRTLEEDILADIGRGFIKSDEVERQNRYPTDDEQAEMEKVLVRFEQHARRLAGEQED